MDVKTIDRAAMVESRFRLIGGTRGEPYDGEGKFYHQLQERVTRTGKRLFSRKPFTREVMRDVSVEQATADYLAGKTIYAVPMKHYFIGALGGGTDRVQIGEPYPISNDQELKQAPIVSNNDRLRGEWNRLSAELLDSVKDKIKTAGQAEELLAAMQEWKKSVLSQ